MTQLIFGFDNPSNYILENAQLDNSFGILGFIDKEGLSFVQSFANDIGFNYDSDVTEFIAGKVQQKDTIPNALAAGNFNVDENLSWGSGDLATSLIGAATYDNINKRIKLNNNISSFEIIADNKINPKRGTIEFGFIPQFNGVPGSNQQWFELFSKAGGNSSKIIGYIGAAGDIRLTIYDKNSTSRLVAGGFGSKIDWVQGQEYIISLKWDSDVNDLGTTGSWVFLINNIQQGAERTTYADMDDSLLIYDKIVFGSSTINNQNFDIDSVILSDVILPNVIYEIFDTRFLSDEILLPIFSYSEIVGSLQNYISVASVFTESPRLTLNGYYHDGADWVLSNDTYDQANSPVEINDNISTLPQDDDLQVVLYFPNCNCQTTFDNIVFNYIGQKYSLTGKIKTAIISTIKELTALDSTIDLPTVGQKIAYTIVKNGVSKWFDTEWKDSNDTIAESNTIQEIIDNIDTLFDENYSFQINIILETDDDELTPAIDLLTYSFIFGGLEPVGANRAIVFMYITDLEDNPIESAKVTISLERSEKEYAEAGDKIISKALTKTTDANGYVDFNLPWSSGYETENNELMQYRLSILKESLGMQASTIQNSNINFTVPDVESLNITNLISAK